VSASRRHIAIVADAIFPFHIGGKETALFEFGKHMVARGHRVDVFTMHWWPEPGPVEHAGMTYYPLMRQRPLYTSAGRRSNIQALAFGLATLKLISRRADVYLVDSIPFLPLLTARAVATVRRTRLATLWHEYWGPEYWKSYASPVTALSGATLERLAAKRPDKVLVTTAQTKDRLAPLVEEGRLAVVPLGIDLAAIDAANPSSETCDVIYAGRLLENKRVDLLIRAVHLLRTEHPGISCVIVGSGPEKERLEDLVRDLNLKDNVSIRPFFPSITSLFSLVKSSRVFVLPSVREGFGLVALEANACGTPVITVDHPDNAARHLIMQGKNGLLSSPDTTDLAAKIGYVLGGHSNFLSSEELRESAAAHDWAEVAAQFERELLTTPT